MKERLLREGFLPVLGTGENNGLVPLGRPNHWDQNNGVLVIYDDQGNPWIVEANALSRETKESLVQGLKRGAYVPHSNDGGRFLQGEPPALSRGN